MSPDLHLIDREVEALVTGGQGSVIRKHNHLRNPGWPRSCHWCSCCCIGPGCLREPEKRKKHGHVALVWRGREYRPLAVYASEFEIEHLLVVAAAVKTRFVVTPSSKLADLYA